MRRTDFFLLFVLSTLVFGLEPITLRMGDTSATYYREVSFSILMCQCNSYL
ncbi:hypothetical protein [Mesotoga sp. B105.6.4]|uniref:hypothetical protein n=1 Tax=Mesotoga sp. B105.6.4 TaxID=1582224 RepID=UPI0015E09EB3|nr:hypothetical protein [Mesotoga sp. B105.6.4]